ncbi:hypothetical protein Tsubulata_010720 [Turnera subulata]|uniref:CCHC-type domain-containing protein n=1 Tax=Turnera subulata TaxID=218843 RepID=A0A9Q0GIS7_9ROSI|nr:hypothetical protein Tsubulata_010720 [Turnera subulata]
MKKLIMFMFFFLGAVNGSSCDLLPDCMSLYVGNLSSRTPKHQLERVFQRFGRCSVRLKDGYGFVVYKHPPNAEIALRALQKRYICGQPLTLTWSNKQPKASERGARSYEPWRSRDSGQRGRAGRNWVSNDRQEFELRPFKSESGRLGSADIPNEQISYHETDIKEYSGEEHHDYGKDLVDGCDPVELNSSENDRWGAQFRGQTHGNDIDNYIDFDRYEPNKGYDGNDNDDNHLITYSGSTPAQQSAQENVRRDHTGELNLDRSPDAKFRDICYRCGRSGHKMRNCLKGTAPRGKFTRFDHRHDNDISRGGRCKGELERFGCRPGENVQPGKDAIRARWPRSDITSSGLGKNQRSVSGDRSTVQREPSWSWNKNHRRKKRARRESGSPKKHRTKKTRWSVSSPPHSDSTASGSRSVSQSRKNLHSSRPHSKSCSSCSKACSLSCGLRSGLSPEYSISNSADTRSRSHSSNMSLSLSLSLGQPLPSSKGTHLNHQSFAANGETLESEEILIDQLQQVEGDTEIGETKIEAKLRAANNENIVSSSKEENEAGKDQPVVDDSGDLEIVLNSALEVKNPNPLLFGIDTVAAGVSVPENVMDIENCQDSDACILENAPDAETSAGRCSGRTIISSEELCMVLRHYGLDDGEGSKRHSHPEACFGAARLWPWEIIYYRRLKKGAISVENYARRVDQNREFGIVDKYIRSSSGWEELGNDNS